jgi:hypothetical protein
MQKICKIVDVKISTTCHASAGSRKERNRQDHYLPAKDKEGDRIRSGAKNKGDRTFHSVSKSRMLLVDFLFGLLVSLLVGVGAELVDINREAP